MVRYNFFDFLKDKSAYFTLIFPSRHWVGALIYLFLGLAQYLLEGLLVAIVIIVLMYFIRRSKVISGKVKPTP